MGKSFFQFDAGCWPEVGKTKRRGSIENGLCLSKAGFDMIEMNY
jgi:hypothetical protein